MFAARPFDPNVTSGNCCWSHMLKVTMEPRWTSIGQKEPSSCHNLHSLGDRPILSSHISFEGGCSTLSINLRPPEAAEGTFLGDQQVFSCHDCLLCRWVLFLIFASRNELGRLVSVADEVVGWGSVSSLIYLTVMSSGGLCPFWTEMTTLSIHSSTLRSKVWSSQPCMPP